MRDYMLLTIGEFVKKKLKWCVALTFVFALLKLTVIPFISWLTVATPLWGLVLTVPISAILGYTPQNEGSLFEQYTSRLDLNKKKYATRMLKESWAVILVENGMQVTVLLSDIAEVYVSVKSTLKEIDENVFGEGRKYYLKNGNLIQKYSFFTDSGEEVYREVKDNIKIAKRVFENLNSQKEEK